MNVLFCFLSTFEVIAHRTELSNVQLRNLSYYINFFDSHSDDGATYIGHSLLFALDAAGGIVLNLILL
jgi:hypothetical protein